MGRYVKVTLCVWGVVDHLPGCIYRYCVFWDKNKISGERELSIKQYLQPIAVYQYGSFWPIVYCAGDIWSAK